MQVGEAPGDRKQEKQNFMLMGKYFFLTYFLIGAPTTAGQDGPLAGEGGQEKN